MVRAEHKCINIDLTKNGYPSNFITETKKKRQSQPLTKPDTAHENEKPVITASIPCVPGLSEAIKRVLAPLDIRTVMRPQKIKWSLMRRVKDRVPTEKEPGIVYVYTLWAVEIVRTFTLAKHPAQRSSE